MGVEGMEGRKRRKGGKEGKKERRKEEGKEGGRKEGRMEREEGNLSREGEANQPGRIRW
jgi:hypothetical protein